MIDLRRGGRADDAEMGRDAIREGRVAVVTLAAGIGSRWTEGAGVVKALHPFCKLDGRHRNFLELHLAKSRRVSRSLGASIPHVFTTGYLTDGPIREHLEAESNYGYEGPLFVSPGRSVGLRMIPMVRDLRFAWEEMPQQVLDEQQQKVRESLRSALIDWARQMGEAEDYTDNLPMQCLHPVGHWYEIPNMLRNGTFRRLLETQPAVTQLLLHNIDTLGASVDPALLGRHMASGACLTFEVIGRRLEDRGGGLARVNGKPRLVEGLAMPSEQAEFGLSYYNSMTTWIDVDKLLKAFGLTRDELSNPAEGRRRRPPDGTAAADVCDAQRRQETLGARAGRRLSGRPVRETLGRHVRAAGGRLRLLRDAARSRPATQTTVPTRRLAPRRLRRRDSRTVRVGLTLPITGQPADVRHRLAEFDATSFRLLRRDCLRDRSARPCRVQGCRTVPTK